MTMKHTPGPWTQDTDDIIDPVYQMSLGQQWRAVGLSDEDGFASVIALCHPANAKLIAAAPEMLEALEAIIAKFNENPDDLETMDAGIKIAEAAIAKATGPLVTPENPDDTEQDRVGD
jgi:hypothetical protein